MRALDDKIDDLTDAAPVLEREMAIVNARGLHARASAKLVKLIETFDVNVEIVKDGHSVGGTSIMGLLMLAATPGSSILVRVRGPQADPALTAIAALVSSGFGERD